MKNKISVFIAVIALFITSIVSLYAGMQIKEDQIINRSLEMNKKCYTGEEVGYFILGNSIYHTNKK
jgi:hypothetical protein